MEGAQAGQMSSTHFRNFHTPGGNGYQYSTYQQQHGGYHAGISGHNVIYGQPQYDGRVRVNNGGYFPNAGGYYGHHSQPATPPQATYGYVTEVQKGPLQTPHNKGRPRASSGSSGGTSGSDDDDRTRNTLLTPASSPGSAGSLDAVMGGNPAFGPNTIDPAYEVDPNLYPDDNNIDDRQRRGSVAKHTAKRRPTYGESATKQRKGGNRGGRGDIGDTYVLRYVSDDETDDDVPDWPSPPTTLSSDEYRKVFETLNTQFCNSAFRWLARYKFRIPKKSSMKEHVSPADRELTEYVHIIRTLIIQRDVPRASVTDERVNELDSVMEGAAEIRHVTIHVSRKHKPDQRVLGFIAAVSEFCWILGDRKGAAAMNKLYQDIDKITRERQLRLMERN